MGRSLVGAGGREELPLMERRGRHGEKRRGQSGRKYLQIRKGGRVG